MRRDGLHTAQIREMGDRLVGLARSNPPDASSLLSEMELLAAADGDPASHALCSRAQGNLLQIAGNLSGAVSEYRRALQAFRDCGDEVEAARTASSLVGALAPAGSYDEALQHAEFAREIFEKCGLSQRSARLDVNVGNIFHRLGKLEEAHRYYERAAAVLIKTDDAEAAAGVMINSAVIAMLLFRFDLALETFREATEYCRAKQFRVLETQSEYNRAYLLYLTGRATEALKTLQSVEREFDSLGDSFHVAQCQLDRAEILAEINLHQDALALAREAESAFTSLGAAADRAKALLLISRCYLKLRQLSPAGKALMEAKTLFDRERNSVWSRLCDLEYCTVLLNEGRYAAAVQIATATAEALRLDGAGVYGIQADLIAAQGLIEEGRCREASEVLTKVSVDNLPVWLRYYACYLKGRVMESSSAMEPAIEMYRTAVDALEFVGQHIGIDDFLLRFSADKRAVYARLVTLLGNAALALQFLERMRRFEVRMAADVVSSNISSEPFHQLRQSLRADYVELFHKPAQAIGPLIDRIQDKERGFLQALRNDSIERFRGADRFSSPSLPTLAADELLVEYFVEDHQSYVFAVADGHVSRLTLNVDRRRLESETAFLRHYLGRPDTTARGALRLHLKTLYELLIHPFENSLRARIIVVPDGCLNDVPFHALLGPTGYVADHHVISYAPSSESFKTAVTALRRPAIPAVIVGLQASDLPSVEQEVNAVAARIRGASVYRGTDITSAVPHMATAALIHIASHGLFRRDDPSFSMLFLGSDVLTPMDVPRMDLQAELITMSACSTGRASGRVEGFMRAFMALGVPAMVASLWEVDDRTTAFLMDAFYTRLSQHPDIAKAMAGAMKCARERWDDPFHWAPFIVIGRTRLEESWKFFRSTCTTTGVSQTT